jgi:hypothetical protein
MTGEQSAPAFLEDDTLRFTDTHWVMDPPLRARWETVCNRMGTTVEAANGSQGEFRSANALLAGLGYRSHMLPLRRAQEAVVEHEAVIASIVRAAHIKQLLGAGHESAARVLLGIPTAKDD